MPRILLVIIAATLLSLTGCTSYKTKVDNVMQSWVGKKESALILAWGPPIREASDGNDGKVLVYISTYRTSSYLVPQYDIQGNLVQVVEPGTIKEKSRMFYVNPEGVIYAYRWVN